MSRPPALSIRPIFFFAEPLSFTHSLSVNGGSVMQRDFARMVMEGLA